MWLAFILTVMAQEPDPVPAGQLRVTAVEQHQVRWTEDVIETATRKAKRAWRKASRQSDDPIPKPEPVESPEPQLRRIHGATITVEGAAIDEAQKQQTNKLGEVLFTLPPGTYDLQAVWEAGPIMRISGIQVQSDRTTQQRVELESYDESDVVTMNTWPQTDAAAGSRVSCQIDDSKHSVNLSRPLVASCRVLGRPKHPL